MEAAKQCERNVLPELFPVVPLAGLLYESHQGLKILPYEEENSQTLKDLIRPPSSSGTVMALIGPEGGFQEEEVQQAQKKGFVPISLGPRTLRSETAALAVILSASIPLGSYGNWENLMKGI